MDIREEIIEEDIDIEAEGDDMIVSQGRSEGSVEQLVAEGQRRYHQDQSIELQRSVNLDGFPKVDFYYKLVAKVGGNLYSIYDADTEYKNGEVLSQMARPAHRGGYYVYGSVQEAIFADVPYKAGGNFIAPRTVIKCICWGDFVVYSNGKMSFSNLMMVAELGLPRGYKANKDAIKRALMEQESWRHEQLEREYNLNLVRRNRPEVEMDFHDSNLFENYFSASAVAEIERLIAGDREQAQALRNGGVAAAGENNRGAGSADRGEQMVSGGGAGSRFSMPPSQRQQMANEIQVGLSSAIADIENRYR